MICPAEVSPGDLGRRPRFEKKAVGQIGGEREKLSINTGRGGANRVGYATEGERKEEDVPRGQRWGELKKRNKKR